MDVVSTSTTLMAENTVKRLTRLETNKINRMHFLSCISNFIIASDVGQWLHTIGKSMDCSIFASVVCKKIQSPFFPRL